MNIAAWGHPDWRCQLNLHWWTRYHSNWEGGTNDVYARSAHFGCAVCGIEKDIPNKSVNLLWKIIQVIAGFRRKGYHPHLRPVFALRRKL